MKKDLVSVIVPVYNVEPYLSKSLDSIISQTYSNIEIILVDDGSKDASGKICDEYAARDSRIRVLHKKNGGVSRARNVGLDLASGEYVSFVDGDDVIDKDYIIIMIQEMRQGNFDIVRLSWERGGRNFTYNVCFDKNGKKVIDENNIDNIKLCANIWGLFKNDTGIRFDESLKNGEDSLFVIENLIKSKKHRMLLMNKPFYHYTIVPKSASELSPADQLIAHQKFLDRVLLMKNIFPKIEFLVRMHSFSDYFSLLCYMIDNKVSCVKGFTLNDVQNELVKLRRSGAKYPSMKAEFKYFLYRYRLVSFFKILKLFKKK